MQNLNRVDNSPKPHQQDKPNHNISECLQTITAIKSTTTKATITSTQKISMKNKICKEKQILHKNLKEDEMPTVIPAIDKLVFHVLDLWLDIANFAD